MRGRLFPTRFNKVLEAHKIALDVGTGILKGVPNPCLRREMDHAIKILLGEERLNDPSVSEVALYKRKTGVVEQRLQSIVLEIYVVIVVEAVDAHDFAARVE